MNQFNTLKLRLQFQPMGVLVADGRSVHYRWQWPISLSIFIGYIMNMGCS